MRLIFNFLLTNLNNEEFRYKIFRYNYKIKIGTTEKCLWKREK